jgi:hypothetical protein
MDVGYWHQAAGQPVLRRFRNRVISGAFGEPDRIAARPDALSKEARYRRILTRLLMLTVVPNSPRRPWLGALMQGKTG